jgi:Tol biopolymer transport system component
MLAEAEAARIVASHTPEDAQSRGDTDSILVRAPMSRLQRGSTVEAVHATRSQEDLMRTSIVCGLLGALVVALALVTGAATAKPLGVNGQITFARFNPDLGDTQVYVVNPDGTHERRVQLPPATGGCPTWFADGSHIATCGSFALPYGGSRIINPDDGTYRDVGGLDPTLFNPCMGPSPDGSRLLCETFGLNDGSSNGIHTIRASDGGDLRQVTSNPGGDDVPLDWSPDGKRIVFQRFDGNGDEGLFVVNANGTGLKQILPRPITCCAAGWSPHGNDIVFSMHATPDAHSSIWVVHSDGSGLHRVDVQPTSACGGLNADPSADGCFNPGWSPDGTKLVFAKGQHGDVDANIYTVNADGSGLAQVTHTGGSQSPDWGTHPVAF